MVKKQPKCKGCGEVGHYKMSCFSSKSAPVKKRTISDRKREYSAKKAIKNPSLNRKALINKLDRVFSIYIRTRNAKNGIARCVTCGVSQYYKDMDCGHFISRGKIGTRFDEMNCWPQCRRCNRLLSGNMTAYTAFMESKYGDEGILVLRARSRSGLPTYRIQEMLDYYEQKVLTL